MPKKQDLLPLEMEINALRQKIKSSNHETVEECERLRNEIQELYFRLARTTRPGRYAGKRRKTYNRDRGKSITPEVIPPDLDLSEYLNYDKETAATTDKEDSGDNNTSHSIPENSSINKDQLVPVSAPASWEPEIIQPNSGSITDNLREIAASRDRNKTIEERFAIVAKRMEERRRLWQENQQKKRPWWKTQKS